MSDRNFEVLKVLTCTYVGEESGGLHSFGGVHSDDVFIDSSAEFCPPIKVVLFVRPLAIKGDIYIALQRKGLRSLRRAHFDGTESEDTTLTEWDRMVMHFEMPNRMIKHGLVRVMAGIEKDDLEVVYEFRIIDMARKPDTESASNDVESSH